MRTLTHGSKIAAACGLYLVAGTACLPPLPDKDGGITFAEEETDDDDDDDDDDSDNGNDNAEDEEDASTTDAQDGDTEDTLGVSETDADATSSSGGADSLDSSGGDDDGPTTSTGPVCGDGIAEELEVCDGADLGGHSCVTQGFDGGVLGCAPGCSAFDTSGCTIITDGNCCTPHGGLGCEVPSIESCVCSLDSYCCDTEWDDVCVGEAVDDCLASCA